jgi:hypothetical protein
MKIGGPAAKHLGASKASHSCTAGSASAADIINVTTLQARHLREVLLKWSKLLQGVAQYI